MAKDDVVIILGDFGLVLLGQLQEAAAVFHLIPALVNDAHDLAVDDIRNLRNLLWHPCLPV